MASRDERTDELQRDLLDPDALENEFAAPSPHLRGAVLATVAPGTRFEGFVRRLATFLDLGELRARELVAQVSRVSSDPWVDDTVDKVRLLHFDGGPRVAEADCGLVHVEPGSSYPLHRHRGDEWAFVLQGNAEEDSGRVWRPGDLVRNPAGSVHAFRALGPEPFVFAVVLHDGIDFEDEGVPQ